MKLDIVRQITGPRKMPGPRRIEGGTPFCPKPKMTTRKAITLRNDYCNIHITIFFNGAPLPGFATGNNPNFPCKMAEPDLVSGIISIFSRPNTHE